MDDFLWDKEVKDFIDGSREADQDLCLHKPEHSGDGKPSRLCCAGLHDAWPCTITRAGKPAGETPSEIMGIRFQLN